MKGEHTEGNQNEGRGQDERKDHRLHVVVHYMAAGQPFKDEDANRNEKVGQFKARVLAAFGLVEGEPADGGTATYVLYLHKTPIENFEQTLGELAGGHNELNFKLCQELIQGDWR